MTRNLTDTINAYFRTKPEIAAVYLFGSFAQGKQHASSDLDLAILFKDHHQHPRCVAAAQRLDRYLVELSRLLRKDPHLVTMNTAGEILLKQIFSKGRCILVNDPKALSLFTMAAYARIADFMYHYTSMKKGFTQQILQG
jgi:uncharacterized protein